MNAPIELSSFVLLLASTTSTTTAPRADPANSSGAASQVAKNASSLSSQIAKYLPLLLIAVVVVGAGYLIVRFVRRYLVKLLSVRYNEAFAAVTARMFSWLLMLLVLLFAIAIIFPSVDMKSVLSSLGFVSVAVGFALRDIIENAFSGWLLMYRETFNVGDQIEVGEVFGDVAEVNVRETIIKRRDGQLVVIPNRDVYKSNIRLQTARDRRRFDFFLEFDYVVDHQHVIETLVDAIGEVDGVLSSPPPKGRIDDTGSESVTVKLMGWTDSEQGAFNACRNRVIQHVIDTMIRHNIPLPDDEQHLSVTETPAPSDEQQANGDDG